MMSQPPVVQARDLAVGYRKRMIMGGLNLEVRAGELVCVLGPNGIGKSTLLRTLSRLQPRLSGHIALSGTALDAIDQRDLAGHIGIVLTEHITVGALQARRVVELGRYVHSGWWGSLSPTDHTTVDWAINAVGAHALAHRDFSRLSDGERQRVMIARALAQQPRLLVLDEPTAFLDVTSRVELWALLRRLTSDDGLAAIVSTHDLELALRTADTIWLATTFGQIFAATPDEAVESGAIAATFASRHVRFDRDHRTFHVADLASAERTEA
jgi:iron complex transport system ATP-binding protein